MSRTLNKAILAGLLIIASSVALVPEAAAHRCTSTDDSCKGCPDDGVEHVHTWDTDSFWGPESCNSSPAKALNTVFGIEML